MKKRWIHYFQPIKKDISNGNEQLRTTNWTSTIIVSLITLIIGSFLTICIQWFAHSLLNGNLTGQKLKEYCTDIIANGLNIDINDIHIYTNFVYKDDSLYFSDSIVFYGSYNRGENFDKEDDSYGGRFIAIFERNKLKFFDRILNIEPNYTISYFLECHGSAFDTGFWFFHDQKLEILDFDDNGYSNFSLTFVTNFASRISYSVLYFDRDVNGKWSLINPDLSELEGEVKKDIPDLSRLYMDTFLFYENGIEKEIYGLATHGEHFWRKSPLSQQSAVFIKFGIWLDDEVNLQDHGCGLIAYIYKNGKMERSSVWYQGSIYYWEEFPGIENDEDKKEFYEFLDMMWGNQGEYGVFYGIDGMFSDDY
jgi:hypothetical protein